MQNRELKIQHDTINELFKTHIDLQDNDRIIFSAPFGTGKTTFLKEFFSINNNSFKVVHLFPVNYSVASNDDVFELIKFDVFYELITNSPDDVKLKDEEFSMLLTGQNFILHDINLIELFKVLIKTTSKIGKSSVEIAEALSQVIEDYEQKHKSFQINELEQIKKYLESQTRKAGSILEYDEYSQLIEELLIRSKEVDGDKVKHTVLIIDDIDRIDPDHIFRLFNVFSSQYDLRLKRNKFGFDKIIFVCDISNIQKMFQHRYGQDVDFTGYVDKFYSRRIFEFDNRQYVIDKLNNLLGNLTVFPENFNQYKLNNRTTFSIGLSYFLRSLINSKQLNLRSLVTKDNIDLPRYKFQTGNSYEDHNSIAWEFLVLVDIMKQLVGDINILEEKLKYLATKVDSTNIIGLSRNQDTLYIAAYCLPFLDYKPFISNLDKEKIFLYYDEDQKMEISYRMEYAEGLRFTYKPGITSIKKDIDNNPDLNLFKLFYKTFRICRTKHIIK